jgi:type I restriction enzyme S subunit
MVSCIGSDMGKTAIAGCDCVTNQQINSLVVDSGDDPMFIYYNLSTRKAEIRSAASGSAQPILNKSAFGRLDILLPPRDEQLAIAHILGTLDDKIELNRRMNETLEAMAQALFKSWFVDFDPVRAKAEGRDTGLPAHTADLFPDSFEDSELGEMPAGWEAKVLDELLDLALGGDWGRDEPTSGQSAAVRCIRGADIPVLQSGGRGKMPMRFLKTSSLEKRSLSDGNLVVEISGGSPTQSTGRVVLVTDALLRRLDAPLVCSNFCRLLKLERPTYSRFVYLWLRKLYAGDELLQFETGTTGIKNFAFTLFASSHGMPLPAEPVLEQFDALVAPLFNRLQANASETDTLGAFWDALLPRLISGELRVSAQPRHGVSATPEAGGCESSDPPSGSRDREGPRDARSKAQRH